MGNGLWFDPRSLQSQADAGAWSRGLALYRNQKVLNLDIDPHEGAWLLQGEVQGSEYGPYEVSIEMALKPNGHLRAWDSSCTCPVGVQCKHGVAMMIKAAYQGLHIMGAELAAGAITTDKPIHPKAAPTPAQIEAARKAAIARAQALAQIEAETQLLQWLSEMDRASGKAGADDGLGPRYPGESRTSTPERYLYLLNVIQAHGPKPQLQMQAVLSAPKVHGGWTKPKPLRTQPYTGLTAFDMATAADREVLQLLYAMPDTRRLYSAYSGSAQAVLTGQAGQVALQQAASTGRLFTDDGKGAPAEPLQWGAPLGLAWQWQELATPGRLVPEWVLRAHLTASTGTSAHLCLNTPPLYLDVARGLCGPVQCEGLDAAQLSVLLSAPPLQPEALKKHQLALAQRLGQIPLPPVLQDFVKLQGVVPTACIHISACATEHVTVRGLMQAQLQFDYQGLRGWWAGQGLSVVVDAPQGRVLLQRDGEAELDAMTRLLDLGLRFAHGGIYGLPGDQPQHRWLEWADTGYVAMREAGFVVTVDDALRGWITHADTVMVQMNAHEPGDDTATSPWFNLSLGMEINGQRHNILPLLPSLIAAAASSPVDPTTGQPSLPPFVYLPAPGGAGSTTGFIRLPTDALKPWMAALLELVGDRAHDFSSDSLKLSRLDALRTSAALGEGAVWDGAQALRDMVRQLQGHISLPDVPTPANLQASLRPYQQQGLNWLQFLREHGLNGILADDMGLGKTLQTLAHVLIEKEAGRLTRPALIVAPVSLMGNWRREAERFTPTLRTLVLHGKERHQSAAEMAAHDVVIAPYSLLQRDRERWLEQPWHIVVLDEAQNIKNASTYAAQVVGELQTHHRLCLSGTPMENHLGELWSLFHFLMPGFLGSQARFKELFRTPIEKQGDAERLAQLRSRITPFMLRRTKKEVATELPDKIESVSSVELSGKQADLYETIRLTTEKTVRDALDNKGLAKSQIQILDALLKLRQVCCDPRLLPLASAKKIKQSAKLEHLMAILPEMLAEGRRVLLFSQFTTMLELIEEELKARDIAWVKLTGQSQKRDAIIERFTSGEVPLFLISLKAGGVGLNLPQADTVIHYDPWWNPAVENQATDRAHRIGQKNQVFVYKLVAQGTIEERILALQERKAALAESMYSGSQTRKQPLFTESDVAELLRPLG